MTTKKNIAAMLPKRVGETVSGLISDFFAPYSKPQVGDHLTYNPRTDKLVIMTKLDTPEYIVKAIDYKIVLKQKSSVTIEKVR